MRAAKSRQEIESRQCCPRMRLQQLLWAGYSAADANPTTRLVQGYGTFESPDGARYVGNWAANLKHGIGKKVGVGGWGVGGSCWHSCGSCYCCCCSGKYVCGKQIS